MNPNINPMFRGSKLVPRTRPSHREDVEEDEADKEGLDEGPENELPEVLAEDDEVPQQESAEGRPPGGRDRAQRNGRDAPEGHVGTAEQLASGDGSSRRHQSLSSFPVRLMKTVSSVGSEMPTTPGTRTVAKADSAADTTRPRASPRRETGRDP